MIVGRGFRRAASFHTDACASAGRSYFDAITNGWGAMPSLRLRFPRETLGIIAYIRALSEQSNVQQSGTPAARRRRLPQPRRQAEGINR